MGEYVIIFSYGYNSNTGEKYLDMFDIISAEKIDRIKLLKYLSDDINEIEEAEKESREIVQQLSNMRIRSRIQNVNLRYIVSTFKCSREEFESWVLTTDDDEIKRRSEKL